MYEFKLESQFSFSQIQFLFHSVGFLFHLSLSFYSLSSQSPCVMNSPSFLIPAAVQEFRETALRVAEHAAASAGEARDNYM
jgi:hypothetical protein